MQEPLVEHRLELDGARTWALELEGVGPRLLLLHGFADSADTWRLVLDLLARDNRRALAVDLPGYGRADPPPRDGPVLEHLDRFVRAAAAYLAEESGADPVIVGNSLGGCLALRAAQDPGTPACAVVPVAPAGFDHPFWFRAVEAQPLLRGLLAAPVPVPRRVVRGVVGEVYRQLVFAQPRRAEAAVVAAFTEHHGDRARVSAHLASGRRLLPEIGGGVCFDLERIEIPVHLVWGDRDRMVSHRGARHVLEALPETTYDLLEGVGHCPQLEAPGRLVDSIVQFVAARLAP